jgi:hypothetical protein
MMALDLDRYGNLLMYLGNGTTECPRCNGTSYSCNICGGSGVLNLKNTVVEFQTECERLLAENKALTTERNALRRVVYHINGGCIGRTPGHQVKPDEWWHMCGFIHGESLVNVMEQMIAGTSEDDGRSKEELAAIKVALEMGPKLFHEEPVKEPQRCKRCGSVGGVYADTGYCGGCACDMCHQTGCDGDCK